MGLEEIRDKARADIHGHFAIPATVTLPGTSNTVTVTARLHRNLRKPFGDLDREGFALVIEQYNQVIFDKFEWTPVDKAIIDFGRERVFRLSDTLSDRADDRYVKMEMVVQR